MQIKFNNDVWDILYVPPHSIQLMREDGLYTLGACDNKLKTIYINDSLNDFFLQKVLCHELTHALLFSYGIQLNIEQEELFADLLATHGQEIIYNVNSLLR